MARKEEKPSIGKRLSEWAMTAGVLVLVGGLVCAFMVVGVFFLHRSLSRNEDENMVVREGAGKASAEARESALDELKKPLPPPPKAAVDPQSVGIKPRDLADIAPSAAKTPAVDKPKETPKIAPPPTPPPVVAAKVPEGPPSRDPSRMDNEGFLRYWLVLAPLPAEKKAYSTPLMICVVYETGVPLRVRVVNSPAAEVVGTIACRPLAPVPAVMVKLRVPPLQATELKDEPLRPSSQVSIWRAETMGMPWACAEVTMASDSTVEAKSVCALAVKAP